MKRGVLCLAAVLLLAGCRYDEETSQADETAASTSSKAVGPVAAPGPSGPLPAPPTKSTLKADHIVLITIDDLSISDSAFETGVATRFMPTLDALASRSFVLTNYHATTPLCTPARYSILTGNYASRATNAYFRRRATTEGMTVPEFNVRITSRDNTLPKDLQKLKFRTGFVGKNHVTEFYDTTYVPAGSSLSSAGVAEGLKSNEAYITNEVKALGFDEAYSIYSRNPDELPVVETRVHNLDWITDGAIRFINGNKASKFFLMVNYTVPHAPLTALKSWNADPRMTPFGLLPSAPAVQPPRAGLTARVKAANRPGMENWLWLDDSIAAVMNSLAANGLLNSTAIIIVGDHGVEEKGVIYNGGTRAPAIVSLPGIVGRTNALAGNIDWRPTIMALAGGKWSGDGKSLVPVLTGQASEVRDGLLFELGYARAYRSGALEYVALRHSNYIKSLAAEKGYPLSHWLTYNGVDSSEAAAIPKYPSYFANDQLYDVVADPRTQNNIVGGNSTVVTQMRQAMQAVIDGLPDRVTI